MFEKPLDPIVIGALIAVQTVLAASLVISGGSFWIDEFGTVRLADVATLAEWWEQFLGWHDSDLQMPLYHFYVFQ